jgi:spore germination cell wall hydrolase CwlJ-like protein
MSYEEYLLVLVMWREARGEGPAGMEAVGHVICNRVNDWKQTWRQVIVGTNQFSSITIRGDINTIMFPLENDPVFEIAKAVYAGGADMTNGAHFYANEQAVTSDWYITHIIQSPDHPVTANIGRHTFRV